METSSFRPFLLLCFGSAAVVTGLAIWMISNAKLAINSPAILVLVALVLTLIGIAAYQHISTQQRAIEAEAEKERELSEKLNEQRHAIDALADGLAVGIFICNKKAEILYSNSKADEMFRVVNPLGKSVLTATISYDLEQLALAAATSGAHQQLECQLPYPEDRTIVAEAWTDATGDRVFLSLYDTTSLRKLERIRQDFVANVSHELRTPLANIRAMAETLIDAPESEFANRYHATIIEEVDRLSLITQDLLILSAAESNPVRRQECDLTEVIRSVVQQLAHKAASKGLKLTCTTPDSAPYEGNHTQLVQVFINLIDNAINYTSEGGVDVKLEDLGERLIVTVSDTGIGIPSDQTERIFERFYRVDKGRSRATGGTGLGLSIVRHILEVHGGTIRVESVLGKGSTFQAELPRLAT